MRLLLLTAVFSLSAAWPTALYGQWYGWDNACEWFGGAEGGGSIEICASVQISTVSHYPGTTLILARAQNLSPVYWGGPIGAIFSLPGAENPQGFYPWYDSVWDGYPAPWLLPFFHQPGYGEGWDYYSFETSVEVNVTDLVGFYGEAYSIEEYESGDFATHIMALTDPGYIVPEPSTVILLGTGLLALGGVAWRRKDRERPGN